MMSLEIFRIYLQRGKYDPAIVFLKARPQSQSWQRLTFGCRTKRTKVMAASVHSVCLKEVLHVAFSTLCWIPCVDTVTWRRAELLCEHQSIRPNGGAGNFEVGRVECCEPEQMLLSSQPLPPHPFS